MVFAVEKECTKFDFGKQFRNLSRFGEEKDHHSLYGLLSGV